MNPINLGKWTSGINYAKWGITLVAVLLYSLLLVNIGMHRSELKCEQAKTKTAETKTKEIVRTVNAQIPIAAKQEKTAQAIKQNVKTIGTEYEKTIKQTKPNPSCDLSDSEFLFFNALTKETRK